MSEHDSHEQWLPVVGWDGLYSVSDQGRVWSNPRQARIRGGAMRWTRGRMMSTHKRKDRCGHWVVTLRSPDRPPRPYFVHSLVLEAFVGPRPDGLICRHLDGNTDNNTPSNLKWGTDVENAQDSLRHGTNFHAAKTQCPRSHPLAEPNLVAYGVDTGHRQCLACHRAYNRWKKHPETDIGAEADRQFASLMAEPGKRQGKAAGEQSGTAIMTEEKVRAMRADHAAGMTYAEMCVKYSVKKSQVYNIVARKSWKHVA